MLVSQILALSSSGQKTDGWKGIANANPYHAWGFSPALLSHLDYSSRTVTDLRTTVLYLIWETSAAF